LRRGAKNICKKVLYSEAAWLNISAVKGKIPMTETKSHKMKPIKINTDNADKIQKTLAAAAGDVHDHTLSHIHELTALAKEAERQLEELGIPKRHRPGAEFFVISGGKLPNTYGYQIIVARVEIKRFPEGWRLTLAQAINAWSGEGRSLRLTAPQAELAIAATQAKFQTI
jgi:hypothetical protein